jgi:hypothetical protein
MSNEKITIQVNDEVIELKGQALEEFLADRQKLVQEAQEIKSAKEARQTELDSAITKLKALGLTESEAKIIIGLE